MATDHGPWLIMTFRNYFVSHTFVVELGTMSRNKGVEVVTQAEEHLEAALSEADPGMKHYHIREALQILLADQRHRNQGE